MSEFYEDIQHADIALEPHEMRMGVCSMKVMTLERLTIVIAKTVEGYLIVGENASWPNSPHDADVGLRVARAKAIGRLQSLRGHNKTRGRVNA